MRGKRWHGLLARRAADDAEALGFRVDIEETFTMPMGGRNAVDIVARRGSLTVLIEVETTARHAVDNAVKARALELPLIIVAPESRLRRRIMRDLARAELEGQRILVLAPAQVGHGLMGFISNSERGESEENETERKLRLGQAQRGRAKASGGSS